MSSELEDEINKMLEESVPMDKQLEAQRSVPKGPVSAQGIGRGGVIRNPNTKRRTQLNNPLTNPRKPSNGKSAPTPTPEEDFLAEHPALAMPSVMTTMDVNARKPAPAPTAAVEDVQQVVADPDAEQPLSYETTLGQLLARAIKRGGSFRFQNPVFKIEITKLKAPQT